MIRLRNQTVSLLFDQVVCWSNNIRRRHRDPARVRETDRRSLKQEEPRRRPFTTDRSASRATDGTRANASSSIPLLTGDGPQALFVSTPTNLVPMDTNRRGDILTRTLATST